MELIYDSNIEKISREIKIKKAIEVRTRIERMLIVLFHNYNLNENIIDGIYTECMKSLNNEYGNAYYIYC